MSIKHKKLSEGGWKKLSLVEQLANVGSEVHRAINWKRKGNLRYADSAMERALELLDFTLADDKNKERLKEVARVREVLVDFFYYDNDYQTTDEAIEKYFYNFNYLARLRKL